MVIGGALIGSVAFIGGWQVHSRFVAAKDLRELQAKVEIEANLRTEAETQAAMMSEDLNRALKDKRVVYRYINREIPNVVPQNPDCRLGSDFIRVFNRAANGGVPPRSTRDTYDQMSDEPINAARGR